MKLKPFILMLPLLLVFSCTKEDPIDITNNEFVPIELTPKTRSFVEKGNDFGFKLLEQVAEQEKGNIMISPLGVNLLFGMILEGAIDGEVMEEVCEVLGFEGGSRDEVRRFCKTMIDRLPVMDKQTKVSISNMVLENNRFGGSNKTFENNLINQYGTKVINRSFSPAEELVKEVNSWAEKQTDGMIKSVLDKSDINPNSTESVFLNSLYFKGKWHKNYKFSKSMTSKENFTTESGGMIKVDMMKKDLGHVSYYYSPICGALSLPYGNGAFSMNIYLPDEDVAVKDVLSRLASGDLKFEQGSVEADLWLPRFACENKRINLEKSLQELGIEKAFEEPWLQLFDRNDSNNGISTFFQSTSITVDEEGTEAATVSVATQQSLAVLSPHVTFHCDHPFIYTITETSTGAILFAGVFRGE